MPYGLGHRVSDLPPVHDLAEHAQLHAHASDRGGLLRGEHAAHMLGDPLRGDLTAGGDGVGESASEPLVLDTSLGRRVGLDARLGDAGAHLGEDVRDLGDVGAALDGDGESVGTGDAGGLGGRHGDPPSALRRFFVLRGKRESEPGA